MGFLFTALVIGFVINIAIAWIAALRATRFPEPPTVTVSQARVTAGDDGGWMIERRQYVFVEQMTVLPIRLPFRGNPDPPFTSSAAFAFDDDANPPPKPKRWSELPVIDAPAWTPFPERDDRTAEVHVSGYGWPLRCLRAEAWWQTPGPRQLSIESRGWWTIGTGKEPTRLPILPIWQGIIANTSLYAAAAGGIMWTVGAARRTRRRKRGKCPMCAYDLKGQFDGGCHECGWNKPTAP